MKEGDKMNTVVKSTITLKTLEKKLTSYDKNSERLFQKVFSQMTFGVKYVYEVSNLDEIISQTNKATADKYSGIEQLNRSTHYAILHLQITCIIHPHRQTQT